MALLDALTNLNWRNPWVIGGVVVAGAAVAFFVLPKLKAAQAAQSAAATGPNESAASQTQPGADGIIIVQEDTPAGPGTSGGITTTSPVAGGENGSSGPGQVPIQPAGGGPTGKKSPLPAQSQPPQPPKQFVHPAAWPNPQGSIAGIAQAHGTTAARLESFPENQYIAGRKGGWNTIYPSDTIRIA